MSVVLLPLKLGDFLVLLSMTQWRPILHASSALHVVGIKTTTFFTSQRYFAGVTVAFFLSLFQEGKLNGIATESV
jgi:hypothetical protein